MRRGVMAHKAHIHTVTENAKKRKLGALPRNASAEARAPLQPKSWRARKIEILLDPAEQAELRSISRTGLKYFKAVYFIPKTAKDAVPHILKLINMDGCVGKRRGSKYNHMYVCGLTPNNTIYPLLMIVGVGNESNRTWKDALEYLKEKLPGLNDKLFIAIVDGDKGELIN